MTRVEKKVCNWLIQHFYAVLVVFCTIISLYIRFILRNGISVDMETFLLPWYDKIKAGGGFGALSAQVGNYSIPYQTIISILTYLPIKPEYGYKIISIAFDYLQAVTIAWMVWYFSSADNAEKRKHKTAIAWVVSINLPMVFLNSAYWGQCDSIYCFFCLLTILLIIRQKSTLAFIAYGFACAFKLQAIFLLPWILFYYVQKREFSIWKVVLVPLVMIVLSLPGILQGRSVFDIVMIYDGQISKYQKISMNYPSFWNLLLPNKDEKFYIFFSGVGIAVTILVLFLVAAFFIKKKNSEPKNIEICFLLTMACVLFLPSMHERYDYLPIMIGLLICFIEPQSTLLFISLCIVNLKDYSDFLFEVPQNWEVLSVINTLICAGYVWLLMGRNEDKKKI